VSALTNLILIPMLILSGLFNKLTSMPDWSSWLQYLTPFRYGFQLIVQNEFRDEVFGGYDYQIDLGYTIGYGENAVILAAIGIVLYFFTFFLLKYNSDDMVA